MKLKIGISPCPNDTYIFYALIANKIAHSYDFEFVFEDVEQLNQMAMHEVLDIAKFSYGAYAKIGAHYKILNAGSALGQNCGPLLIANKKLERNQIINKSVAIPGANTTANLLLGIAFPQLTNKKEVIFSDIEDQVINNHSELGLIIHENRFTYQERGLVKIADLGEYWEQLTGLPIPLGGISIHRKLSAEVHNEVDHLIKLSIEYAMDHEAETLEFCKDYAQEMDVAVMKKHIDLYVNSYSLDLGKHGRSAILRLLNGYSKMSEADWVEGDIFCSI